MKCSIKTKKSNAELVRHAKSMYKNFVRVKNSDRSDYVKFANFKNKQFLYNKKNTSDRNSDTKGNENEVHSSSMNATYLNDLSFTNNDCGLNLQEAVLLYSCFFRNDGEAMLPHVFGDDDNKRIARKKNSREDEIDDEIISINRYLHIKKRRHILSMS
mmetsp:Transcript_26468/g.30495  ORF Transcript_26468/g.30495 Transcript_26468/m.30495 type:complete len:158 (+) Transcript_26468:214-687(+)